MLIEFSVSNFLSFRERQTLSMVAAPRLGKKENTFKPDVKGEKLPPKLPQARKNAEKASAQAQQRQLPSPSTQMHLLLDRIQELAKPIPVNAARN